MATANVLDPECEFVADVPEKLICIICTKVLSEPHLTECCGQHYCKSCLEKWLLQFENPTCPQCRTPNPTHILNKDRVRDIMELEVYCTNHQGGCQWKGKLEVLGSHQSGCGYTVVKCSQGCGQKMRRSEIDSHLQKECPSRPYECEHCKHKDTYHAITKPGGHYETCPNYPVKCPLKCGKTVQRKDVQNHISGGECQIGSIMEEAVDCTNGCGQQVKQKDLNEHLRNECSLRTYKCEHCGYEKTYLAVTNHYNACNNYPLPCPKGCGATVMRKDITAHQNECLCVEIGCPKGCGATIMRKDAAAHQNECPNVEISCPKGCGATIMRKDAAAHQNECPNVNIDCPNCGIVGISRNHECIEVRRSRALEISENNDYLGEHEGPRYKVKETVESMSSAGSGYWCYNCIEDCRDSNCIEDCRDSNCIEDCCDNDCIEDCCDERCACNGRVSLGLYCCIWWLLLAAVGMVIILGAISILLVTQNQEGIEECETFLLVYGAISVLCGLTLFVSLCICNCKCAFHHWPRLTAVSLISICSLVVYLVVFVFVNYKYTPEAFGNANGGSNGGSGLESHGGDGTESPMEACISGIQGIHLFIIASDCVAITLCILCILNVIFSCFFKRKSPLVYYRRRRFSFSWDDFAKAY